MRTASFCLFCSTAVLLVGCAERQERQLARPVSTVGPSYTTVPAIIDSGSSATVVAAPPSGTVTVGTANDAGRASAGTRGELLGAVDSILANWKPQPRDLARVLITKYGPPHEVTQSRLMWYNNGPWKRTELLNAEIPHNFPTPHNDMLQQVIDYRVPPDKVAEVLAYDGSILIDRTRGEMTARCSSEEMNTLALNLAHDIITGQRTVEAARETYSSTVSQSAPGIAVPLMDKLQFITAVGPTADPDQGFNPAVEIRQSVP